MQERHLMEQRSFDTTMIIRKSRLDIAMLSIPSELFYSGSDARLQNENVDHNAVPRWFLLERDQFRKIYGYVWPQR